MKYVNRWGLMRNSRNESLSDHTLDVIFISHALVVIANTYYGKSLDEGRIALLSAFHDAPEIITGDLPTPVKYFDPEIRTAYDHVEQSVKKRMIATLPEMMQSSYEDLMKPQREEDAELLKYVKAADKISALIKCIEEEQSGNNDANSGNNSNNNNSNNSNSNSGAAAATPEPTAAPTPTPVDKYAVASSMIGESVGSLTSAIGSPNSSSYTESCLVIGGEDGFLYYDGFTVETVRRSDGSEMIVDVF